jgi:hypothetical protein
MFSFHENFCQKAKNNKALPKVAKPLMGDHDCLSIIN